MCGYVIKIKKIVRARIRDSELELLMVFNLKELWAMPRETTVLAFFFPVRIGTRASMLERHGEKCEGRGGRRATTERKVISGDLRVETMIHLEFKISR